MNVTLFRLENKCEGEGPFYFGWHKERHENDTEFPTPIQENLDFIEGIHKCACASKSDFLKWFTVAELKELEEYDYRIYLIEIDHENIQCGEIQVIYSNVLVKTKEEISLQEFTLLN